VEDWLRLTVELCNADIQLGVFPRAWRLSLTLAGQGGRLLPGSPVR
jgi:hypothetical protein